MLIKLYECEPLFDSDKNSSPLHKNTVDYDYFQFMKEDNNYTFIFTSGISITLLTIYFLNVKLQLHQDYD